MYTSLRVLYDTIVTLVTIVI